MTAFSVRTQVAGLIGWLFVAFAAGGVGAVASIHAGEFYGRLDRPDWAPPAWVFGPVWTVLYVLLGLSAWLVWRDRGIRDAATALTVFVVQLAANALWTWIFFAWHRGGLAFAEILVLLGLIAANVVLFWRRRRLAGILLLPYLLWVSFATLLTYAVWQRNPELLG